MRVNICTQKRFLDDQWLLFWLQVALLSNRGTIPWRVGTYLRVVFRFLIRCLHRYNFQCFTIWPPNSHNFRSRRVFFEPFFHPFDRNRNKSSSRRSRNLFPLYINMHHFP